MYLEGRTNRFASIFFIGGEKEEPRKVPVYLA